MAILVLGSVPGVRQEMDVVAPGLVLHFVTYAGIALLLFTGMAGSMTQRAAKCLLTIALMGAIDEYVQSFFPYRRAAIADWYIDVAAGFFVCATLWAWMPKWLHSLTAQRPAREP